MMGLYVASGVSIIHMALSHVYGSGGCEKYNVKDGTV